MSSNSFLFFSEHCEHSKKLLNTLTENNLINNYELCCIDLDDIKIPDFVTSVPTIYIANQKRLLVDEALFHYINIEINRNNNQSSNTPQMETRPQQMETRPPQINPNQITQQHPEQSNDISGFFNKEMGNSLSDSYSFINSNESIPHSYSFLGNEPNNNQNNNQNQNNQEPTPLVTSNSSKSGMMDKAYDQLLQDRNSDIGQNISQMRV